MKLRLTLAFVVASVAVAAVALAADWPRFLGPNANGIAPDTGINKDWENNPPRLLWKVPLGDEGYAGPSVAESKVFIIDHKGAQDVVRALDFATGKDVWDYAYNAPGKANYGFARATPTYDDGLVYTLSRDGDLYALSAADGKLVWSRNLRRDFGGKPGGWGYAASPIVDGDRLVVLPGGPDANVAVLNKKTGATIWAGGGTVTASYATPVVATINGVKQYVVFTARELSGVSAADGKVLWRAPLPTKSGINPATPIVVQNYVFYTSGYGFGGGVLQITGDRADQVWFSKAMQSHFSSPVYYSGYIYGTTDPGDLICLAPRDGTVLWRQKGFEKGGLIIVDGAIIALDGAGGDLIMAAAEPGGYKELGRLQVLGGQSWTAPIIADGKLIIRNKSALACLDLMR